MVPALSPIRWLWGYYLTAEVPWPRTALVFVDVVLVCCSSWISRQEICCLRNLFNKSIGWQHESEIWEIIWGLFVVDDWYVYWNQVWYSVLWSIWVGECIVNVDLIGFGLVVQFGGAHMYIYHLSPYKMCLDCPFSTRSNFCSTIFAIGGVWMWLDLGVYLQHPFRFFPSFFYVNILHLVIPESCTCVWFQLCLSESSWGVIIYFRWEMLKVNLMIWHHFQLCFSLNGNIVQKKGRRRRT